MPRVPARLLGGLLACLLATGLLSASSAGAATSLVNRLIPTSMAEQLGFPTVAGPAAQTTKTGTTLCKEGAQVIYQNKPAITGLIDELYYCRSATAANQFMTKIKGTNPPSTALAVPKALGTNAYFSGSSHPVYVMFWARGRYVAAVGFDVAATNDKTTQNRLRLSPLTLKEQTTLQNAAVKQDRLLR